MNHDDMDEPKLLMDVLKTAQNLKMASPDVATIADVTTSDLINYVTAGTNKEINCARLGEMREITSNLAATAIDGGNFDTAMKFSETTKKAERGALRCPAPKP